MEAFWLYTLRPLLADIALPPTPFLIALAVTWPFFTKRPRAGPAVAAAAAFCIWGNQPG